MALREGGPDSLTCRTASPSTDPGRVYVADRENDRIQVFSAEGNSWRMEGPGDGSSVWRAHWERTNDCMSRTAVNTVGSQPFRPWPVLTLKRQGYGEVWPMGKRTTASS
jgi:hypothetical protein